MTRACGERQCPVDCRLEEWSGWSSCSGQCNGGVRTRTRGIRTHPRHGGAPCDQDTETVACNSEACDADCSLSTWSEWSTCSKACDGGFEIRERGIALAPRGDGSCPSEESHLRQQFRRCSAEPCKPKDATGLLHCSSKLDVVMLIDASSSMGQAGFDAAKSAAQSVIKSFSSGDKGAQVSVLLYSGPQTWDMYQNCTSAEGKADPMLDCRIIFVEHFTSNIADVVDKVGRLKWMKGVKMTGAALSAAKAELRSGRKDAQSVVIVITDGKPIDARATKDIAAELKQIARVMWLTTSRAAPVEMMKQWASKPLADNMLALDRVEQLPLPSTVNRVIANVCPLVE